jgi:hypothetical protein
MEMASELMETVVVEMRNYSEIVNREALNAYSTSVIDQVLFSLYSLLCIIISLEFVLHFSPEKVHVMILYSSRQQYRYSLPELGSKRFRKNIPHRHRILVYPCILALFPFKNSVSSSTPSTVILLH